MGKVLYIALFIIISVSVSLSYADIYKYVDEDGVTLFTNISRDGRYEKVIKEQKRKVQGSPSLYNHIISGKSKKYNIAPSIIKAVITAESSWQPSAVSDKGAIGLMQLMPSTISDMRVKDPYDPEDNIEGGTKYLRLLLDRFKGDLELALAAYNSGPGTVTKYGGIPPIKETRNYVRQVLSLHNGVVKSDSSAKIHKVTYDDGTVLYTNTPSPAQAVRFFNVLTDSRYHHTMTDHDILRDKILNLKEKKNALLIAHNYQRDEVQDLADFTGDSLELSRTAATVACDVIVFCGVNFMAESASILSPEKTVLLPESGACCPMADMVTVSGARNIQTRFPGYQYSDGFVYPVDFGLRDIKKLHPGAPVVTYVNSTADVKAESDICCTSANAIKVVESLDADKVICIPDKNLSAWIAKNTKKEVIAWDGFCHVHDRVTSIDVENARKSFPNALLLAHPECRMEVIDMADHVTSTSGMLRYAASSDAREFIIGTEVGLLYRLRKENPGKAFHPLRKDMICPNMKKTTLASILRSLETMSNVVKVPEEIRVPAKQALDRMLAL